MKRVPIAVIVGFVGFFAYVVAVLAVADKVVTLHWAVQVVYFIVVGTVWVLPVRWLMLWSVHQR